MTATTSSASTTPDVSGTVFEEGAAELARIYAVALLDAAESTTELDAIVNDLEELVQDLWNSETGFGELMSSVMTDASKRDDLLVRIFEGRAHPTLLRFLRILNQRDRLVLTPLVAQVARVILDRRNNRVPVTIRSAVPLNAELLAEIEPKLKTLVDGGTPVVTSEVDPELIGGLVVQVGDQVYDASVRHHLNQIRENLSSRLGTEVRRKTAELIIG